MNEWPWDGDSGCIEFEVWSMRPSSSLNAARGSSGARAFLTRIGPLLVRRNGQPIPPRARTASAM